MKEVKGHLYANETEFVSCDIHYNEQEIQIFPEGKTLLIWKLSSLIEINFNANQAEYIHKNTAFPKLTLFGKIAQEVHHQWSIQNDPTFISKQNKAGAKGAKLFIFLSLTIIAVIIGLYFIIVPIIAESAAESFPIETEIQLGSKMAAIYDSQAQKNDSANFYLKKFIDALKIDCPYPLSMQVIESEDINAFAVPGGHMFIYSGLLNRMKHYEELVALIGHESSHVSKRHSLKSIFRSSASSMAIALVIGDISGISAGLLSQADNLNQLGYSRELETEADLEGLKLMQARQINPSGMIGLLKILLEASGEVDPTLKYLSSHPDTKDRIDEVKKNLNLKKDWNENSELRSNFHLIIKHLKY